MQNANDGGIIMFVRFPSRGFGEEKRKSGSLNPLEKICIQAPFGEKSMDQGSHANLNHEGIGG